MKTSALPQELTDRVAVTHRRDHDSVVVTINGRFDVAISFIEAPRPIAECEAELVAAAVALVAAQATLARRVSLDVTTTEAAARAITKLAALLYGTHAYTQSVRSWADPVVTVEGIAGGAGERAEVYSRAAVLLWSGGKDAIAALKVLRANGFKVLGLHVAANPRVETLERDAAERLAEIYELPLRRILVDWRIVDAMLRRWSTSTHRFPLANEIPHGRDVVLVAAAAAVARMSGAMYVTAGYEWDLWTKTVPYRGRSVSRHDSQSHGAGVQLDTLLREHLGVRFFSPIAALSEHAILTHLLQDDRSAWKHIASCFWGRWCGQCQKCLRYALAEARLGVEVIPFQTQPLDDDSPALKALLERLHDPAIPFWEEQVHALFTVVGSDPTRLGPRTRARLAEAFDEYRTQRNAIELSLNTVHPDDLAPADFSWSFDAADHDPTHEVTDDYQLS